MRIAVAVLGLQPDPVEQLGDPPLDPAPLAPAVDQQRLADDLADRHARVERGVRVLEDHLHLAAQRRAAPRRAGRRCRCRRTGLRPPVGSSSRRTARPSVGLAAAGFADQPERLASLDGEADAVDRAHLRRLRGRMRARLDREVLAIRSATSTAADRLSSPARSVVPLGASQQRSRWPGDRRGGASQSRRLACTCRSRAGSAARNGSPSAGSAATAARRRSAVSRSGRGCVEPRRSSRSRPRV